MTLRALVTTVGSAEDARRLADAAVEQRLAACVQITAIESVYRWRGALQHEPEWRLLFKTTALAEPALRTLILQRHPYELPALYALQVDAPSAPYREWVVQNADGDPAPSS